ncbi:hypothetical protein KR044_005005, partial [Drosophila immigrans]
MLKHSFVHKLHLATGSPLVTFLNWSANGRQLQVDYIDLQDHLSGTQSMFRCLNVQHFTQQLLDIGFERLELPHEPRPMLHFQHEHFQSGQPEQLLLLATPQWEMAPLESATKTYSALQMARARFQTLLLYHNDVRLLQQQEPSAEQLLPRRGRICNSRQPTQLLTAELAPKHVNPRETVLQSKAGAAPEYAGFYGSPEPALIGEFFAEYLPRYGIRNSGYKDIVVDASKANAFQQNLPIGIVYSEDEEELDSQKCEEETTTTTTTTTTAELKSEDVPICAEPETPLSEDFELEQVMQELCGVALEIEESVTDKEKKKELDNHLENATKEEAKLKRKKTQRKSTIGERETELESPIQEEDHMEKSINEEAKKAVMSPKPKLKRKKTQRKSTIGEHEMELESPTQCETDEDVIRAAADGATEENYFKEHHKSDEKSGTSPKKSKRRRYNLRNSNGKQT